MLQDFFIFFTTGGRPGTGAPTPTDYSPVLSQNDHIQPLHKHIYTFCTSIFVHFVNKKIFFYFFSCFSICHNIFLSSSHQYLSKEERACYVKLFVVAIPLATVVLSCKLERAGHACTRITCT